MPTSPRRASSKPRRIWKSLEKLFEIKLILHELEDRCTPSVFTVSNTSDTGLGSLRQAITSSNSTLGLNTINFAIGSVGSQQTITPLSALPSITNPVLLDGMSQGGAGYMGVPLVEINGGSSGVAADGFDLEAGSTGSTIRGFVIDDFSTGAAVQINASNSNFVQSSYIGTNVAGSAISANSAGVVIGGGSSSNTIGGTSSVTRNIISGNNNGVSIFNSGTNSNIVEGNYIGTNAAGTAALANNTGVIIEADADNNTIGGTIAGAGNVISGNSNFGVAVTIPGTSGDDIEGNLIGTDFTGTVAVANGTGVLLEATGDTVGGTTAAARNVISGNTTNGVEIESAGTTGNTVEGNFIGTTITGSTALGNGSFGVLIHGGATSTTIGGSTSTPGTGAGNVISGNQTGIGLYNTTTTSNSIEGNLIGTNAAGVSALPNSFYGVEIFSSASSNTIGGTNVTAVQTLTVTNASGSFILNFEGQLTPLLPFNASATQVQSALNSLTSIASVGGSVSVTLVGNVYTISFGGTLQYSVLPALLITPIGGFAGSINIISQGSFLGNVISGNTVAAMNIGDPGTAGNTVLGNYVGTDVTGTVSLDSPGITIQNGASGNTVGGTTVGARNIISGNSSYGLRLQGTSGTSSNVVEGNWIGLSASGTALPNVNAGLLIGVASNNTIGGTLPGAGNVISGNAGNGILINTAASSNTIEGNFIGTDPTGTTSIPNTAAGITIGGGANNTIGGTTSATRNIISGNTGDGVNITGTGATGNVVEGNYIGTNASGTSALANGTGISIASDSNLIGNNGTGATDSAATNVISGNTAVGISISGNSNHVAGNYIGTNAAGTAAISNGDGISIQSGTGNIVGTDGTNSPFNADERNIISGDTSGNGRGIVLNGANTVAGNWIGLDVNGNALANEYGIQVTGQGSLIGGTANVDERNVISGNSFAGIIVRNPGTTGTVIEGNYIGTDPTGTLARPNGKGVVVFTGPTNVTIGGTTAAARNVISGNTGAIGVEITGSGSSNNAVEGNYIGTNAAGTAALANDTGVQIDSSATKNTIGGSTAVQTVTISGSSGTFTLGFNGQTTASLLYNASSAAVQTALNALTSISGGGASVSVSLTGTTYTITFGGTLQYAVLPTLTANGTGGASGVVAIVSQGSIAGNVISGNSSSGIHITGSGTTGNFAVGNYLGTDITGQTALANIAGVLINSGAAGNTIGGSDPASQQGLVSSSGLGFPSSVVTAPNGDIYFADTDQGTIYKIDHLTGTQTPVSSGGLLSSPNGMALDGLGNLIVANGDFATTGTVIRVNIATGVQTLVASGGFLQVPIDVAVNAAGDYLVADYEFGSQTQCQVVEVNHITGVQAAITPTPIPGGALGIALSASGTIYLSVDQVAAPAESQILAINPVTGASSVVTTTPANNYGEGLSVLPDGNIVWAVQNGPIGLTPVGEIVEVTPSTRTETIVSSGGDLVDVADVAIENDGNLLVINSLQFPSTNYALVRIIVSPDRNIISGNTNYGVFLSDSGTSGNVVEGDYIGTDVTGSIAVPNNAGIETFSGSTGNTIGGPATTTGTGAGNVISGNTSDGVILFTSAVVEGNLIGTNASGTIALGNGTDYGGTVGFGLGNGGVYIVNTNSSTNDTIGGIAAGDGNVISGNTGTGINIADANSNLIEGNYIGLDISGTTSVPNLNGGVALTLSSSNTIGGSTSVARNIISGNTTDGVNISGSTSTGNTVEGDYIGTDATGTIAVANGVGVVITTSATGNTIGGTTPGAGNLVSGNSNNGISLSAAGVNNLVQGNYVGTNAAGSSALPNASTGIGLNFSDNETIGGNTAAARNLVSGNFVGIDLNGAVDDIVQGNWIGINAAGTAAIANIYADVELVVSSSDTIGGTSGGDGNVISGSAQWGVGLEGSPDFSDAIQGNLIGTDPTGTFVIPNVIGIFDAGTNGTIGGTTPTARNVISGNTSDGVFLSGSLATGNVVEGNYIGTDITGTIGLANGNGVLINNGASSNTIGGTATDAANTIADNKSSGVQVLSIGTNGNSIRGNSIYGNAELGIDLGGDGVTSNDSVGHTGPNLDQDFPALTFVGGGAATNPQGILDASPNTTYSLDFYANNSPDPSGYGQGQFYLGSTTVTTDALGHGAFSAMLSAATTISQWVSVTATDPTGNTSEFAQSFLTDIPPTVSLNNTPAQMTVGITKPFVPNLSDAVPGKTYQYQWAVTYNGTPVALPDPTILATTSFDQETLLFTPERLGTYVVSVTVTDSRGGVTTAVSNPIAVNGATLGVTITGDTTSDPVPFNISVGQSVTLTSTIADPRQSTTDPKTGAAIVPNYIYQWNVTLNGAPFTLPAGTNTTSSSLTYTPTTSGIYVASLAVSDQSMFDGTTSVLAAGADSVAQNASGAPQANIVVTPGTAVTAGTDVIVQAVPEDLSQRKSLTYTFTVTPDNGQPPLTPPSNTAGVYSFTAAVAGNYTVDVSVTDDQNRTTILQPVVVRVSRATPIVAISGSTPGSPIPAIITSGGAVTLNGSASDADPNIPGSGSTNTYTLSWSVQGFGCTVTPGSGSGSSFTFTPSGTGTIIVTLTATDQNGFKTSTLAVIAVTGPAIALSVTGPSNPTQGQALTWSAALTPTQSTATYSWTVLAPDGTTHNYSTGSTNSLTLPNALPGRYDLTASVMVDGTTLTSSAPASGTFAIVPHAPIAVPITIAPPPSPRTAFQEGDTVNLSTLPTEPGVDLTNPANASYLWLITGPNGFTYPGVTQTLNVPVLLAGTYNVSLTVRDNTGASGSSTASFTVNHVPPSPILKYTDTGSDGTIGLQALVANPGGAYSFSYTVTLNGQPYLSSIAGGASYSFRIPAVSSPTLVKVAITDSTGATGSLTTTIQPLASGTATNPVQEKVTSADLLPGSNAAVLLSQGFDDITVDPSFPTTATAEFVAVGGHNVFNGGPGINIFQGDSGSNIMNGGTGPNTYFASGSDTLNGGAGTNDYVPVTVNAPGTLNITSGTGANTIDLSQQYAISLNLSNTSTSQTLNPATGQMIQLSGSFQTVLGTTGNDTITAASGSSISGGGGNDLLTSNNSNNVTLSAGSGLATLQATGGSNVMLMGGAGTNILNVTNVANATLIGGSGNADSLIAGPGSSFISLVGGSGNSDSLITGTGVSNVSLIGGSGSGDSLLAGPGGSNVSLIGGSGNNDSLLALGGTTTGGVSLIGGSGNNDSLVAGVGGTNISLIGGSGSNDSLLALGGNVSLIGGSGNADSVVAGAGTNNITLVGGSGSGDSLLAGTGTTNVSLIGGSGNNDSLLALGGTAGGGVSLIGGSGNTDSLIAGPGSSNITLVGGSGNSDSLLAGTGSSSVTLIGGSGNSDSLIASGGAANISLVGGSGNSDSLLATSGANGVTLIGGSGNADSLVASTGNVTLIGGSGNSDSIVAGMGASNVSLIGGSGNSDSLVANAGSTNISLIGGSGNHDSLIAVTGNVTLIGGSGNNNSLLAGTGATGVSLIGGSGNSDSLIAMSGSTNISLIGGSGNSDSLIAGMGSSAVSLIGGSGSNDSLLAQTGSTNISLLGGSGNNDSLIALGGTVGITLLGGSGSSDSLIAGAGSNAISLIGGSGSSDSLVAGAGSNAISLVGGSGNNDSLYAGVGAANITLVGGSGNNDSLLADTGTIAVSVIGGSGSNDSLVALGGTNVTLVGGSGDNPHLSVSNANGGLLVAGLGQSASLTQSGTSTNLIMIGGFGNNDSLTATGGVDIAAVSESGSSVSITTASPNNYAVGQQVNIAGISPSGYDGTFSITGVNGNTFTYTAALGLGAATITNATADGNNNVQMVGGYGNNDYLSVTGINGGTVIGGFGNNDSLATTNSNDITLIGGFGDKASLTRLGGNFDYLLGQSGNNDSLISSGGGTNVSLVGGSGGNLYISDNGSSNASLLGGTGNNDTVISANGTNITLLGGNGNSDSLLATNDTNITMVGGTGNSYTLTASGLSTATLLGGSGNSNTISVSNSTMVLAIGGTGAANSLLDSNGNSDTLVNGSDSLGYLSSVGGNSVDLFGGGGTDFLSATSGANIGLYGEDGDNTYSIYGTASSAFSGFLDDLGTIGLDQSATDNLQDGTNIIQFMNPASKGVSIDLNLSVGGAPTASAAAAVTQSVDSGISFYLEGLFTGVNDSISASGNDYIEGGSLPVSLVAGGGNSTLVAGSGGGTLVAGSGTDSLVGGTGKNAYVLQTGHDTISQPNTASSDVINLSGLSGPATLNLASTSPQAVSNGLTLTLANADTLAVIGSPFGNTIIGNSRDNQFTLSTGNNNITDGSGFTTLQFLGSALGTNIITPSAASSVDLDFHGIGVPIEIDLSQSVQSVAGGTVQFTGSIGSRAVAAVLGTTFGDVLMGNPAPGSPSVSLIGGGGRDSIVGGSGSDYLQVGDTQVVLLDFDTYTALNPGTHIYTQVERDAIQQELEGIYNAFMSSAVDGLSTYSNGFVFTQSLAAAQTLSRDEGGSFATIYFNEPPVGGQADEVDFSNSDLGGSASVDASLILGYPGQPDPTSANYIAESAGLAAHELGHLLGLRHTDSFGPIGSAAYLVLDSNGNQIGGIDTSDFYPSYQEPTTAIPETENDETIYGYDTPMSIMASPASVGSTRFDTLGNITFSEREAIRMAFDQNGVKILSQATPHNSMTSAQALGSLPGLVVPNTLNAEDQVAPGVPNTGQTFSVGAIAVAGHIGLGSNGVSQSDWYSFNGVAGDYMNFEADSSVLPGNTQPIDTILRVYDSAGNLLAFNDDELESTDSLIVDFQVPTNGKYYVQVDTYSANPATNTTQGNYILYMYNFHTGTTLGGGSTLVAGSGSETLVAGSGNDLIKLTSASTGALTVIGGSGAAVCDETAVSNPNVTVLSGSPLGSVTQLRGTPTAIAFPASLATQTVAKGEQLQFDAAISAPAQSITYSLAPISGAQAPTGATVLSTDGEFDWTAGDQGTYQVELVATSSEGSVTTLPITIAVTDVAPILNPVASTMEPVGTTVDMNGSVANMVPTDAYTYTWVASLGSTIVETLTGQSISFNPGISGTYGINLTVKDTQDGLSSTETSTVNVTDVTPVVVPLAAQIGVVGSSNQFDATYSYSGSPSALTLSWTATKSNNQTVATGTGATFTFNPTYVGVYSISFTATTKSGLSASQSTTITVGAPPLVGQGGFAISAIRETDTGLVTVATLTDPTGPNSLSTYSATIYWGDGTASAGTITQIATSNNFTVQGRHTYTGTGSTSIVIGLSYQGVLDAAVTSSATVTNPALIAQAIAVAATRNFNTGSIPVATFTDPGGPDSISAYSATINWGDGTISTGSAVSITLGADGKTFTVSASHTYAIAGTAQVTVTIQHGTAPPAPSVVSATASISNSEVNLTAIPLTATQWTAFTNLPVATFIDPSGADSATAYNATIDWGDGTQQHPDQTIGTVIGPVNGVFTVLGSHAYVANGSFTATVSISHVFAQTASITDAVTVKKATPLVGVSDAGGTYSGSSFPATANVTGINGTAASSLESISPIFAYYAGISATGTPSSSAPIAAGTYTVVASFAGSADYASATSVPQIFTISQAPPTVTVTDAGGTFTGSTFPATSTVRGVSGSAVSSLQGVTPTIAYYPGSSATGNPLGAAPSAVGTYTAVASFAGSPDYATASATTTFTIKNAAANIAIATSGTTNGTIYFGQALTFTATVSTTPTGSGTPTGNVDVYDTTTKNDLGTIALANGKGSLTTSSLPPGNQTFTLTYQGDGNYLSTSGTVTVNILESIYVLAPTGSGTLNLSGSAGINIAGLVAVDSNSSSALIATGAPSIKAGAIQVVGGDQTSGSPSFSVKPQTGAPSSSNPLAGVVVPSVSGSVNSVNLSGSTKLTINPGIYSQITVSGSAALVMTSGTYIITGGGFNASGAATITGTGVTIFNVGSNYPKTGGTYGGISISGSAAINLQAMATGIYAGIAFVQPSDNAKPINLSGAASLGLNGGVVDAPSAILNVAGSALLPHDPLIVNELIMAGSTGINALSGDDFVYTPDQIRTAYGVNQLSLDGTGQTIAIVDAYDNPEIFQALDEFDSQFGTTETGPTLFQQYGPASSFLSVVNQNGQTSSLPGTDPSGPGTANWEMEEELDVEWVHALAPGAQIVLVEANSQSLGDLMTAVATAADQPNVSVVSMSWGFVEGVSVVAQDEAQYDSDLTTPAGHQGVTFVASTGDFGAADPQYPSFSPNVVAVGGTSLYLNDDNSYNSETGWGYYSDSLGMFIGGGGGASQYESEPNYQEGVQSTGFRTTPDVSLDADPATGVWLADPYNNSGNNPWQIVGGTSLSAPVWAGLFALADQGRTAAGEGTLGSSSDPTATQEALYNVPQSDYNTVSVGYNGYSATAGYNLVAGLGSPIANQLVPDLIANTVSDNSSRTITVTLADIQSNTNGWGGYNTINLFDALVGSSFSQSAASDQAHGDQATTRSLAQSPALDQSQQSKVQIGSPKMLQADSITAAGPVSLKTGSMPSVPAFAILSTASVGSNITTILAPFSGASYTTSTSIPLGTGEALKVPTVREFARTDANLTRPESDTTLPTGEARDETFRTSEVNPNPPTPTASLYEPLLDDSEMMGTIWGVEITANLAQSIPPVTDCNATATQESSVPGKQATPIVVLNDGDDSSENTVEVGRWNWRALLWLLPAIGVKAFAGKRKKSSEIVGSPDQAEISPKG